MSEGERGIAEMLQAGISVVSDTYGHSMEPLLYEGKTKVQIAPLKKEPQEGDLVLITNPNGKYILHRMIGKDEERYYLRGDNGMHVNYARKDRAVGIVTEIYRNGRWFPVTDRLYQVYVHIWMDIFPFRRAWFRLRAKVKIYRKNHSSDLQKSDEFDKQDGRGEKEKERK